MVPLITRSIVEARSVSARNRVIGIDVGAGPFSFIAGQYVRLGEHGLGDRRPYSIASAPAQVQRSGTLEFLIQVDDSGSPGPHLPALSAGRLVDVEGPEGSFVLPAADPGEVLFVGGGTGIAPLRSMLWQLLETTPGARIALVQSGRSPAELAFADEFEGLAREGRIGFVQTVTRWAPDSWQGVRGRIGRAELEAAVGGRTPLCLVCGPDSLVEDVPRLLAALGIPASRILTEQWHEGR